jgi:general secretion pathway protein K
MSVRRTFSTHERRRALRRRRRQRGMAFILVLGALTILTVMLAEVQDESSAEFSSALSARDAVVAEYAARSATNLSRLLISAEPMIRNSLFFLAPLYGGKVPQLPVWSFSDQVLGAFNDATGAEAFSGFSGLDLSKGRNLGLPGAAFEIKVVDEDSKINVNAAVRESFSQMRLMQQLHALMSGPQYDPLFERRDSDDNFSDRQTICAAIIDWVDNDQQTMNCDPFQENAQEMPAEDSFYEQLRRPYHRRNAPFDSLEELRMIRGLGDDFWATFVEPDPDQPEKRTLTIWGASGQVNVNTASPQTLLALVCSSAVDDTPLCKDPLEMQKFLTVVTLARGFTMGAPPFSSPKAFISALNGKGLLGPLIQAAGLQPVKLKSDKDTEARLSTESKVFSIYATGVVRAGKRETRVNVHTVVDFRNAPSPAEPSDPNQSQNQSGSGTGTGTGTGSGTGTNTGTGVDPNAPDALKNALAPNPGGNVVYFRVN